MDITDPARPSLIDWLNLPGWGQGYGVALRDTLALVASGESGLQIVSVANPASLQYLGGVTSPGEAYALTAAGNLAYLADGTAGLQIIDCTDPGQPRLLASVSTPARSWDVAIGGTYAYAASLEAGIQVIDLEDLRGPRLIGTDSAAEWAIAVALTGESVFAADRNVGLVVASQQCEAAAGLEPTGPPPRLELRIMPNPFQPSATIVLAQADANPPLRTANTVIVKTSTSFAGEARESHSMAR